MDVFDPSDLPSNDNALNGEMDRLTQLQDSVDELVHIMSASVRYLTESAPPKEVDAAYKVAPAKQEGVSAADFENERKRLVQALLREAKKVEYLISVAPSPPPQDAGYAELAPLQAEMDVVNKEYLEVLAEAERLQGELNSILNSLLEKRPT